MKRKGRVGPRGDPNLHTQIIQTDDPEALEISETSQSAHTRNAISPERDRYLGEAAQTRKKRHLTTKAGTPSEERKWKLYACSQTGTDEYVHELQSQTGKKRRTNKNPSPRKKPNNHPCHLSMWYNILPLGLLQIRSIDLDVLDLQ